MRGMGGLSSLEGVELRHSVVGPKVAGSAEWSKLGFRGCCATRGPEERRVRPGRPECHVVGTPNDHLPRPTSAMRGIESVKSLWVCSL